MESEWTRMVKGWGDNENILKTMQNTSNQIEGEMSEKI
jgi:hypothetical protein